MHMGQKHFNKGELIKAAPYYTQAWQMDPHNDDLMTILAYVMNNMGARAQAIALLERLLKTKGLDCDILSMIGQLANDMRMYDIGEKVFRIFIDLYPQMTQGYSGLATSLAGQDRQQESIDLLQSVIPMFPEDANLWNTLASHLNELGRGEDAITFFKESIRLDPENYRVFNNISLVYQGMGDIQSALEALKECVKLNSDHPEPLMGLGTLELTIGDLEKGWKNYAARKQIVSAKSNPHFLVNAEDWIEQDVSGKTVLIMGEQGIGDEVLFAFTFKGLYEQAGKLIIGCDRRLVPTFQRTYPNADVYPHITVEQHGFLYRAFPDMDKKINDGELKLDYKMQFGDWAAHTWSSHDAFTFEPSKAFEVDPERAQYWKERLDAISDRPKVGISWRSGNVKGLRATYYPDLDDIKTILEVDGVDFINLQYGDCAEELAELEKAGLKIHHFDDLDLFKDIDDQMALINNFDLTIGPGSAPAAFSTSVGVPVWYLIMGYPWWGYDHRIPPHTPQSRLMITNASIPWRELTTHAAACLKSYLNDGGTPAEAADSTPFPTTLADANNVGSHNP